MFVGYAFFYNIAEASKHSQTFRKIPACHGAFAKVCQIRNVDSENV